MVGIRLLVACLSALSTTILATCLPTGNMTFDYVIVGGGTAGMTLGSRLSEDPEVRVLVVEAGADKSSDPLVLTPGLFSQQVGNPSYDWAFLSTPQPNMLGRIINQPRGKQLGGSSATNIMVMMYPNRENLDAWGALGNPGWSFDALSPYYKKMETVTGPGPNAAKVTHVDEWYDPSLGEGSSGPLRVSFGESYPETLNGAWVETFSELGLNMTADPRTGEAIGGFQNMQSVDPKTKTRSYAATAHYGAEQRARTNLVVMTSTVVKKIITQKTPEGVVATGVLMRSSTGEEQVVSAAVEVILSCGSLQSPQILELSGIGDGKVLSQYGIPVVIDNPNVGEHLQDHAIVAQLFEVKDGIPSWDLFKIPAVQQAAIAQYMTNRTGPFSESPLASAYTPFMDREGRIPQPDVTALLDAHLGSDSASLPKEDRILHDMMSTPDHNQMQYHLFPFTLPTPDPSGAIPNITTPHIAAMALLSHPFSRGDVHIVSADIDTKPAWNPNFLSHPLDIELLARAVQFTENIVSTPPFADALTGSRFPDIKADTVDAAKDIVRQVTISSYHPSGSLSMRPEGEGGVVDPRLVVYGTRNLRVVDASIFPLETSGNIQATVYAVAERAADIIKEDRKARRSGGA